jgi:protein TonB
MNDWTSPDAGRSRIAEIVLWSGAVLVMLIVHAGALRWVLSEPPLLPADTSPPPAIMIELAPKPEAVKVEANEVAVDETVSPLVESETLRPVEEPTPEVIPPDPVEPLDEITPEDIAVTEPVEEVAAEEPEDRAEEIDPVVEDVIAQLENVEVPIPTAKPQRKVVKKEQPQKERPADKPKRKQAAPASRQAEEAQAEVTKSNRNAAKAAARGSSSNVSPARWQSRLMAHLERRKRYPSGAHSRGEQGTVYVRFRIDDAGNVLSASLARSSGFPELDQEVLSLIRRASPVPTPPPGVNKNITAPVRFSVR